MHARALLACAVSAFLLYVRQVLSTGGSALVDGAPKRLVVARAFVYIRTFPMRLTTGAHKIYLTLTRRGKER